MKPVHYLLVLFATTLTLFCVNLQAAPPPSRLQVYDTYIPAKIARGYIKPLLQDGETISLFRGKIIINGSAHTHSNILELLERIDHRAQKLLVHFRPISSVSKPSNTADDQKNNAKKQTPSIARFSGSSTNGKITINKQNHRVDVGGSRKVEQITVLEGEIGYLRGGTEGYKNTPVYIDGFFTNKATLKKNGSGHYISARIEGDIATVHLSKKDLRSIKSTSLPNKIPRSTKEISISLGTWAPIPTIDDQPSDQEIRVQLAP